MKENTIHLVISILGFASVIGLAIAMVWGYIANVFKLLAAPEFALMEVVRIVGLIVPFLGSVMGFVG